MSRLIFLLSTLFLAPTPLWAGWFLTPEQEGLRAYDQGDYETAVKSLGDEFRRGTALYRKRDYAEAVDAFNAVTREEVLPDAMYNMGNSYFQMGQFQRAIDAYEQALGLQPGHADAEYNLALARQMLAAEEQGEENADEGEQKQEDQSQEEESQQDESKSEEDKKSGDSGEESEQQDSGDESEQPKEGDEASDTGEASEEQSGDESSDSAEQEGTDQEQTGDNKDAETGKSGEQDTDTGEQGEPKAEEGTGGDQIKDEPQQGTEAEQPSEPEQPGEEDEKRSGDQMQAEDEPTSESMDEVTQGGEEQEWDPFDSFMDPFDEGQDQQEPGEEDLWDMFDPFAQTSDTGEEAEDQPKDEGEPEPDAQGELDELQDQLPTEEVTEFDQMGVRPDEETKETAQEEPAQSFEEGGETEAIGAGLSKELLEQWLDRVEGDPARLLRNQFALEEAKEKRRMGGKLVEIRPW